MIRQLMHRRFGHTSPLDMMIGMKPYLTGLKEYTCTCGLTVPMAPKHRLAIIKRQESIAYRLYGRRK